MERGEDGSCKRHHEAFAGFSVLKKLGNGTEKGENEAEKVEDEAENRCLRRESEMTRLETAAAPG